MNNVLYFGCQKGFKHLKWSSRSLILSPLYRPHKISYKCFIVTMCLSHTISQMLSLTSIYENLTVTRNPPLWGFFIMHRLVLAMINLHTKFEMPSSSHSKGKSGAPNCKNGSHDLDHASFWGNLSCLDWHWPSSVCLLNLKYAALPISKTGKVMDNLENGVV